MRLPTLHRLLDTASSVCFGAALAWTLAPAPTISPQTPVIMALIGLALMIAAIVTDKSP